MPDIGKCQRGVTLIELLIAMTILAIGLLAISGMQVDAIQANSFAQSRTAASSLAQGIAEQILSWSTGDPRLQPPTSGTTTWTTNWTFTDPNGASVASLTESGGGTYTAQYTVDNAWAPNVDKITIQVKGGQTAGIMPGTSTKTVVILKRWNAN